MRTSLTIALFCALAIAGCKNKDDGTSSVLRPTVGVITPSTVQAGEYDVLGEITGTNFVNPVSVDLGSGIATGEAFALTPSLIRFHFSVDRGAALGPRTVTVNTAVGSATLQGFFSIQENAKPIARFLVTPPSGSKDYTTFVFDGSTSSDRGGHITSYEWKFGDGEIKRGMVVRHKYKSSRTFQVTLTVIDSSQAKDSVARSLRVDDNRPPVASFSISPGSGRAGTTFRFDASATRDDGHINRFDWNFGDGISGRGPLVEHRYVSPGTYQIVLTAIDNRGLSDQVSRSLSVSEAPGPGPGPDPDPGPGPDGNCPFPAQLLGSACCYKGKCCEGKPLELGSIGWCSGRLMCTAGASGYQPPLPQFKDYPGASCSEF